MACFYKHVIDVLGVIKSEEFRGKNGDYKLLKKHPVYTVKSVSGFHAYVPHTESRLIFLNKSFPTLKNLLTVKITGLSA